MNFKYARFAYKKLIDALLPFHSKYMNTKHVKDLAQIQSSDFKNYVNIFKLTI